MTEVKDFSNKEPTLKEFRAAIQAAEGGDPEPINNMFGGGGRRKYKRFKFIEEDAPLDN
jgi:hypothetical protein